jgi:zinc transport system permease protein
MFIDSFIEPLTFTFIQRALIAGTLLGIVAPLIGTFLVVRKSSNLADGLSHIALLGVGIGLIVDFSPILTSIITAVIFGILIEFLRQKKVASSEAIIVLFLVLSLSLISILNSKFGFNQSLESLIFGSINTLSLNEIYWIILIFITNLGVLKLFYNQFFITSLNPELAKARGVKVNLINYLQITLAATIIASGIKLVGGLLISSLLILPVLTSLQLKTNFKQTMLFASIFSVMSLWIGIYLSWFLDLPTGSSIVLINIFSLGLTWLLKNLKVLE